MNENTNSRINHSNCDHEKTAKARKICRDSKNEKAERRALSVRPVKKVTPAPAPASVTLDELREIIHSDPKNNYLMSVWVVTHAEDGVETRRKIRVADVFIEGERTDEFGRVTRPRDAWIYGAHGKQEITINEKIITSITLTK